MNRNTKKLRIHKVSKFKVRNILDRRKRMEGFEDAVIGAAAKALVIFIFPAKRNISFGPGMCP